MAVPDGAKFFSQNQLGTVPESLLFLEEMPADELVYAGGHAEAVPTVTKDEGMDKLARLKAMLNKSVVE